MKNNAFEQSNIEYTISISTRYKKIEAFKVCISENIFCDCLRPKKYPYMFLFLTLLRRVAHQYVLEDLKIQITSLSTED